MNHSKMDHDSKSNHDSKIPDKAKSDSSKSGEKEKRDSAANLERELKETFPASDTPKAVQPKGEGAGAPAGRKSVGQGMEKKLAEEIELNKEPPEKAV